MVACVSFTFTCAWSIQVAQERRRTCQFTQRMPSSRPAGLMCCDRKMLSRIGAPVLTDWNTKSRGPSDFTAW